MKKLTYLLLFVISSLSVFGQSGTGWNKVNDFKSSFRDSAYFTKSVSTVYGDLKNSQVGVFNVLDYGATNGGTVEDQTAIQAAVDAASALTGSDEMGGTVIIPAGKWYITSAVTLKKWVNIQVDDNAWFNFPANYTGSMWSAQAGLSGCTVNGGNYYLYDLTPSWTLIDLRSNASAGASTVYRNTFENMWCSNVGTAMKLTVRGDGCFNANVFNNIYVEGAGIFVDFSESAGSNGMDGNMFSNCTFQFSTDYTTIGIDSLNGSWNMFNNCMFWDWENDIPTIIMGTTSSYNTFYGGGLYSVKSRLTDLGVRNQVVSDGTPLTPFSDSLVIRDFDGSTSFVDKLTLIHNGAAGTAAVPAGDIGIKLKSRSDFVGVNGSARIVAKNSANDDYGSTMVLQTHGTADNSTTYVDALTLNPLGSAQFAGSVNYVLDNSGGGNDTYTATVAGTFVYVTGKVITFHPLTLNTGACTLAINGGTAYAIKTQADGNPANSDMVATGFYPLCWDGANWILMTK
jgi:hypothetical protein